MVAKKRHQAASAVKRVKQAKQSKQSHLSKSKELTRYQRFGLFFFIRTRVTILLWLLLASFGTACYTTFMQREGFPDVAAPYSTVDGTYFVGDRERVDREVSQPAATAISKVEGVKKVTSRTGDNFFSLQIEFKDGVTSETGNKRVQEAVERQRVLPESAKAQFKPLYVNKLTYDGDDALIAVSSDSLTTEQLQSKAELVAKALDKGGTAELSEANRIKTIDTFRHGTDPATGAMLHEQQGYDWIALPKGDSVVFSRSVIVGVQAKESVDVLHLDTALEERLAQLRQDPQFAGLGINIAADFAHDIRSQIGGLQENLIGGLLAVLLVSFLLISLRASLITAVSMVVVLMTTVGLLYLFGLSLNTITLFSLILCLGLIVDDTTIMAEAIDKGKRSGAKPREVVSTAIGKVGLASTAGTLTTMLGFAPLLFISGIMGEFIWAIPITIITSLAVSLFVSLTLIPLLAKYTLLRGKAKQLTNPVSRLETATAHGLSQLVRRAGQSRKKGVFIGLTAIAISVAMFIGGVYFAGKLKFNIFPATKDSDALMMSISYDRGTSVVDAERASANANAIVVQTIGKYVEKVSYRGTATDTSALATISLTSFKDRDVTAPQLAAQLQDALKDFGGAQVRVSADSGPAPATGFTLQIMSEDGDKAARLAQSVQIFLQNRELKRTDGTGARFTDVTITGDRTVQRIDGKRYLQVDGTFAAEDVSTLVALAQDAVKKEFTADRLQNDFGLSKDVLNFNAGQEAENQESFGSMVIAFPVLIIAMYILLAVQFRSTSQPLMIFLAIPFSFFGVTAGLYLTDNSFSFFTMLAIFALLGIAVNNTILLTDYANKARAAGARRTEAMAQALEERFRPLLTTSLTSVVALIPLALSDPFWEALSFTLIFGLLSSTFLVVIAFPYYYLANELIRSTFNRRRVFIWLGTLVAVSVIIYNFEKSLVGSFIGLYVLGTFLFLVGRVVLRKTRARRARA